MRIYVMYLCDNNLNCIVLCLFEIITVVIYTRYVVIYSALHKYTNVARIRGTRRNRPPQLLNIYHISNIVIHGIFFKARTMVDFLSHRNLHVKTHTHTYTRIRIYTHTFVIYGYTYCPILRPTWFTIVLLLHAITDTDALCSGGYGQKT